MNHKFKLKPGKTAATNDARLLNYALKSGCDVCQGEGGLEEWNGMMKGEGEKGGVGTRGETVEDFSSCSRGVSCYPMPPMSDNHGAI